MLSKQMTRFALRYNRSCAAVGVAGRHFSGGETKYKRQEIPPVDGQLSGFDFENARPYETIPGPTIYDFVRGFLPGGDFRDVPTTEMTMIFERRYGPLIRMPGVMGNPVTIITMNPDDYATVYRNEGPLPYRRSFNTLTYHRQVHRKEFFQGVEGIIATSGEKWAKVRSAINPILMSPSNSRLYLNTMLDVNDEFLARIREIRDPVTQEMPDSFEDEINRLTFETVAAVALNVQLGLIRKNRDSSESKTIIHCMKRFFDLAFYLDVMPSVWKYIKTPKFKEMMSVLDTMTDICSKYINEALARIEHDHDGKLTSEVGKERSVLEKLLKVDKRVAIVMALDMMMAGVDTTSTTLTGILLCLAKNPDKQAILFDEIRQVLPHKDSRFTMDTMRNLPYLRACIKEAIRIYPVLPGTMRRTPHDIVLSGYHIPKGIDVTMGANLQLRFEKFVPRAAEFLPERFLRSDPQAAADLTGDIARPFMYLPFGFGPRTCAGKRIVNMELEITIARLIRNFHIAFNYPMENPFKAKFIFVPNIPLKFRFEERSN